MLLLLIACSGKPTDTAADQPDTGCERAWYVDADLDGFGVGEPTLACEAPSGSSALPGDCDDGDPGVYPGAPETCDGVDQDCDDQVDEDAVDATGRYTDADSDGFGVGEAVSACDGPVGSTASPGDCDDSDPTVYPGAVEQCEDEIDQDCDGGDAHCRLTGALSAEDADAVLGTDHPGRQSDVPVTWSEG